MLFISSTLNMLNFNLQYHPLLEEVSPRFLISEDFLQLFSHSAIFFTLQRENLLDSLNLSPMNINPVLGKILNGSYSSISFLQNEELNNKKFYEPMSMYDWLRPQIYQPWDIYISSDLVKLRHYPVYYPIYSTTWVNFNESRPDYPGFFCTHYLIRCPNTHSIYWKAHVPLTKPTIHRTILFHSRPGGLTYSLNFNLNLNDPSKKI